VSYYTDDRVTIYHGDCIEVMRTLPDASVDAVVTDPPYGLEFMGKDWDAPWKGQASRQFNQIEKGTMGGFTQLPNHSRVNNLKCASCDKWKFSSNPCVCAAPAFPNARRDAMVEFQLWFTEVAAEAYRVLKPGGHLLAFGGTRTWHRLAVAIEDAGFEVRDSMAWMYGSGFPKSLDVSKAIDKRAGALQNEGVGFTVAGYSHNDKLLTTAPSRGYVPPAPATPAAEQWQGWGTALKPAHEPIVVARKPLIGTVAANVLTHGTGALNIDGCRIAADSGRPLILSKSEDSTGILGNGLNGSQHGGSTTQGRWPANVILDESQAAALDAQSGLQKDGTVIGRPNLSNGYNGGWGAMPDVIRGYGGEGGASRFFYCPKASKKERPNVNGVAHPTVKPMALMQYLVRLVTPPGGTVLEPFAGSGTTIEAALNEGFNVIGIEMTDEYLPLIMSRIERYGDKLC
jgi:site-specific DNA-methyltransferase (adenine-specific)